MVIVYNIDNAEFNKRDKLEQEECCYSNLLKSYNNRMADEAWESRHNLRIEDWSPWYAGKMNNTKL